MKSWANDCLEVIPILFLKSTDLLFNHQPFYTTVYAFLEKFIPKKA